MPDAVIWGCEQDSSVFPWRTPPLPPLTSKAASPATCVGESLCSSQRAPTCFEPRSPALQADSLLTELPGKPKYYLCYAMLSHFSRVRLCATP